MRHLIWFVFLFFSFSAIAQDSTSNASFIGAKPQYGFIIPHSKSIRDISSSRPWGIALDYGWMLAQEKDWRRCNCYSRAGFSLFHANYANPDELGTSTNLIMFAEPFFNYRGDWMTSLRMGVGPSYISKIYDKEDNPENLFFSSHLSFLIHLDLSLLYRLTDQWYVSLYAKYNHISNGGIDEPNKGMNFPTFGAGIDYLMRPVDFKTRQPLPHEDRGIIPSVEVFATMKNVTVGQDEVTERTFGYGVMLKARKRFTRLNGFNMGAEYLWDGEIRAKSDKKHDHQQVSMLVGHDLTFGKFIFSQYWGTYLYAPYYEKDFFQRYALTYQVTSRFRCGVTLKAHAEVAQNFNVLLTYDLR